MNIRCSVTIADAAHVLGKGEIKKIMMKSPEGVFAKRSIGYDVIVLLEKSGEKSGIPAVSTA